MKDIYAAISNTEKWIHSWFSSNSKRYYSLSFDDIKPPTAVKHHRPTWLIMEEVEK